MAASEVRVKRIVDYLNDGEELGVEGAVGTPPRSPAAMARLSLPRFRWPRLARLGKKGEKTVAVVEEEEEIVAERSEQVPEAVSTSVEQAARKCEPASTNGTRNSDLGMGLSLVFLLAKTSDEFNKMVKVRSEMEALLKQFKHQVRETSGGNNGHDMSEPHNNPDESTTWSCVTDRNDRSASTHQEEEAVSSGAEAASWEKSSEDDESCARVDGLEEQFHAELERLQVTYGSDVPLFAAAEELDSEPSDEIDDYRREDDDDELGEVVEDEGDIDDDDETEYNGVSALELERRLHELLHERNRERIEELEAALRRAEKMLAEKEMEVCLWKDTAKFALRQENELQ
ncbi:hypothetical protein PR202_ga14806 [Eleusine coracana subsp. coracana]|uniref:Protein POLAR LOCALIZATION DURING ASYMMETRIC DIVISION AND REDISTRIBUTION n=1 Tax=Eleusine coracana subsp. coracana TaxID=191504 RepID=A0AAV5CI99_ELECO|nr:hypothetical protein QOZ80_6BG0499850 [Eleusine coracana subsp. coracana]GJM97850.1 hypothetical protein PR202_ga14806 [Eleusine coracana subsp. coracana]